MGITQNIMAQERFFLTAPELSRLAEEAHMMVTSSTTTRKEHHDLSLAVWKKQEENIAQLKTVLVLFMNPMKYECEDMPNIITIVVMHEVEKDVRNQEDTGQQKFSNFDEEQINTNELSIWARMKKVQLKTWKSAR